MYRLAMCQFPSTLNKTHNLFMALKYITHAAQGFDAHGNVYKSSIAATAAAPNNNNTNTTEASGYHVAENGGGVRTGARVVVLPEMFNCPYNTSYFKAFAENIPQINTKLTDYGDSKALTLEDEKTYANQDISTATDGNYVTKNGVVDSFISTTYSMARIAALHKIILVAGSIPEIVINPETKATEIYNTCVVLNEDGEIIAKHRKVHLFDVSIPGRIEFKESDVLSAGNQVTTADASIGRIGIGICYDIRFPEYAITLAKKNCSILIYPGAFNMTTGPLHWTLLARGRAVDNQCWVAVCSPSRDLSASYHAWGHSSVISPWGEVVATTEDAPAIVYADIDMKQVQDMRQSIPVWKQRRFDIYE